MPDYWRPALRRRISRRRMLSTAGAGLTSALLLAACGSDDDSKPTPTSVSATATPGLQDRSDLLVPLSDETKTAKRGGVLRSFFAAPWPTYDVMAPGTQTALARRAFSQLLRIRDGVLENTTGEVEGNAAESWELSPDRTTLVLH